MCISGLGSGDILSWLLPLVSVEKSALWRYLETVGEQKTGTRNGALISYTLHLSCIYHIVSFHCRVSSFPLLSLNLLVYSKLLHKGNSFLLRINRD